MSEKLVKLVASNTKKKNFIRRNATQLKQLYYFSIILTVNEQNFQK